jgi:hypothetical protein
MPYCAIIWSIHVTSLLITLSRGVLEWLPALGSKALRRPVQGLGAF